VRFHPLADGILAVLLVGPLVGPIFHAWGWPVLEWLNWPIYLLGETVCPQPIFRLEVWGAPMVVCSRCWAAVGGLWLIRLGYSRWGRGPGWRAWLAQPEGVRVGLALLLFTPWVLDILAADLGYIGTSKWDSYYGKYDNGTQAYYMIGGPQFGWPLYPLYNFLQLLTTTVKTGWKVVAVDSVPATSRLLAAFLGKSGQLTVAGLDTLGAQLNAGTTTNSSYTIGGFKPSRPVNLLVWNANADGLVVPRQVVTADANGVVTVTIPQHAAFVLTTVRLG